MNHLLSGQWRAPWNVKNGVLFIRCPRQASCLPMASAMYFPLPATTLRKSEYGFYMDTIGLCSMLSNKYACKKKRSMWLLWCPSQILTTSSPDVELINMESTCSFFPVKQRSFLLCCLCGSLAILTALQA